MPDYTVVTRRCEPKGTMEYAIFLVVADRVYRQDSELTLDWTEITEEFYVRTMVKHGLWEIEEFDVQSDTPGDELYARTAAWRVERGGTRRYELEGLLDD
jgi:hypothetical protein